MTELEKLQQIALETSIYLFLYGLAVGAIVTALYFFICKKRRCQHTHTTRRVIWGKAPHAVEAKFCLDCNKQISETNE